MFKVTNFDKNIQHQMHLYAVILNSLEKIISVVTSFIPKNTPICVFNDNDRESKHNLKNL